MKIEAAQAPFAGQFFHFTVLDVAGRTRIKVFVDALQIFDEDCPDPPCHEMVLIPPGTRSSLLRVVAQDLTGATVERKFTVADFSPDRGSEAAGV
jgi:hypothetical protein